MSILNIDQYLISTNRHKLIVLNCNAENIENCITQIQSEGIIVLNIGKELARFITGLNDHRFLTIETYDFIRNLLDTHKTKIPGTVIEIVAIYNLGILLEPELEINLGQLFSDFSKSSGLLIIWDNPSEIHEILTWKTQQKKYYIDLGTLVPKTIPYAI